MSLAGQVVALATRIGQEIKAVRASKADDTAVVHLAGSETVTGAKAFTTPPTVPTGNASGHPVRRDDARLSDPRTPTAHSHSSADVTDFARASAYQASPVGGRGDRVVFGDEMSPLPRIMCVGNMAGGLGVLFYLATVAAYDDAATKVRLCTRSASAGTGSLTVGVFIGSDPTNLPRVATATATTVANGLVELTLSNSVSWTAGQYVVVAEVMSGFTTVPSFAGPNVPSAILNAGAYLMAVGRSGISAMPTSLNLASGGGSAGLVPWWALTG